MQIRLVGRACLLGCAALVASLSVISPGHAVAGPDGDVPDPGLATAPLASPGRLDATEPDDNPLSGPWAGYNGPGDPLWSTYTGSRGHVRKLLHKIVREPRTRWYGDWIPTGRIRHVMSKQIARAQFETPGALVPIADFRSVPWERAACGRLPARVERAQYKAWTREFAAGIADAHVSVVMQPDGPFALCAPHASLVPSHLIRYAVKLLSRLPNTSVYIDAGASDWLRSDPAKALKILLPAGVAMTRGFALNSTHYASTADQIRFGAAIAKALAARGVTDKHFVVNTAANGRPFNGYDYRGPDFDNAATCQSRSQLHCVTLGIPPTADVGNPAWRLSDSVVREALEYCDGYEWIGRPWLTDQNSPFDLKRALAVARTTPY